jgi:hypothetical protein
MPLGESDFRALLDVDGLLAPHHEMALAFPATTSAFTVFSQRGDARIDAAEWSRHAERFLATRIGLTVDKTYDTRVPQRDIARVVLAPKREGEGGAGTRVCWGRPRTEEDLLVARGAASVGAGLLELATRCPQVWLVEVEGDDDVVALRLATILAGVMLGPILGPGSGTLFGPKTARGRLGL